jgi:hypothetical protein
MAHLANARYEAQPFSKLLESSLPVAEVGSLFPSKGSATLTFGPLVLSIPVGATPKQLNLMVSEIDGSALPPPAGYRYVGAPYQVASANGSGLVFVKPIEARFTYSLEGFPAASDRSVRIAAWDVNSGRWQLLRTAIDSKRGLVSAKTDRLTIFAPVAPRPDR